MTADAPTGSPPPERRGHATAAHLLRILLVFIVLAGVALRCVVVLTTQPHPKYHESPFRDEIHYRHLARNLVEFKHFTAIAEGFQTHSTRSPVYPALLALTNWFTDFAPKTHQWLNFGLDCINILLIGMLGARLSVSRVLCALWPRIPCRDGKQSRDSGHHPDTGIDAEFCLVPTQRAGVSTCLGVCLDAGVIDTYTSSIPAGNPSGGINHMVRPATANLAAATRTSAAHRTLVPAVGDS